MNKTSSLQVRRRRQPHMQAISMSDEMPLAVMTTQLALLAIHFWMGAFTESKLVRIWRNLTHANAWDPAYSVSPSGNPGNRIFHQTCNSKSAEWRKAGGQQSFFPALQSVWGAITENVVIEQTHLIQRVILQFSKLFGGVSAIGLWNTVFGNVSITSV